MASPVPTPLAVPVPRLHVAFPDVRALTLPREGSALSLDRAFFERALKLANPAAAGEPPTRLEMRDDGKTWLVVGVAKAGVGLSGAVVEPGQEIALTEGAVLRVGSALLVYREGAAFVDPPDRRSLGELTRSGLRQSFVGPFTLPALARQVEAVAAKTPAARVVSVVGAPGASLSAIATWVGETLRPGRPFAVLGKNDDPAQPIPLPEGGTLFIEDLARVEAKTRRSLLDFARTGELTVGDAAKARRVDVLLVIGRQAALPDEDEPTRAALETNVLRVPSLAERREDIASLALQLLALQNPRIEVEARAMEALSIRDFPGDTGELAAVIAKAAGASGKLTYAAIAALG